MTFYAKLTLKLKLRMIFCDVIWRAMKTPEPWGWTWVRCSGIIFLTFTMLLHRLTFPIKKRTVDEGGAYCEKSQAEHVQTQQKGLPKVQTLSSGQDTKRAVNQSQINTDRERKIKVTLPQFISGFMHSLWLNEHYWWKFTATNNQHSITAVCFLTSIFMSSI